MNKYVLTGALILVLTSLTLSGRSQPLAENEGGPPEGKGRFIDSVIEDLSLTPEQQTQFKEQRQQHHQEVQALQEQLRDKRQALKNELSKPSSDEDALQGIASDMKKLQGQMIDYRIDRVLEMKQILTPEQYQTFHQKIEERKDKPRGKWREHGNE